MGLPYNGFLFNYEKEQSSFVSTEIGNKEVQGYVQQHPFCVDFIGIDR